MTHNKKHARAWGRILAILLLAFFVTGCLAQNSGGSGQSSATTTTTKGKGKTGGSGGGKSGKKVKVELPPWLSPFL